MNVLKTATFAILASGAFGAAASADHIWINEFHYDNAGGDVGEFVEIAIRTPNGSGFTAADYGIEFYNGSNGEVYGAVALTDDTSTTSFLVAGSTDTITLFDIAFAGIQNGAPDGIALVNTTNNTVEQFLSYEGVLTATNGIASGLTSIDIGVSEGGATAIGSSVGAVGQGFGADQFGAASFAFLDAAATPGAVNAGQTFVIPEPASLALVALGGLALMGRRRTA